MSPIAGPSLGLMEMRREARGNTSNFKKGGKAVRKMLENAGVILLFGQKVQNELAEFSFMIDTRSQQTFSVKDQLVNIFGCVGHMVSITTTQLYSCSTKAVINNT